MKDLVDMMLLSEPGHLNPARLRDAVHLAFGGRRQQVVPEFLQPPPAT